jgi:hypothetical protein
MADPITMGIIGAAMGGAKYLGDVEGNENDRRVGATTQKWSPWTGQQAKTPRKANLAGSIIPGALTGVSLAQSLGGAGDMGGMGMAGAANPNQYQLGVDMTMPSLSPWDAAKMMYGGK